tara:strand:- start:842 stop:1225 length:384 start_codon:yes stop_codon:yes gene_type:complete
MKKITSSILIIITVIVKYIIIVIDRFAMSPFIGVDLPQLKKVMKVDEITNDEEIGRQVVIEMEHETMYRNDYLPRARKRAWTVITTTAALYLFFTLSWYYLALGTGVIFTIALSYYAFKWITKKRNK